MDAFTMQSKNKIGAWAHMRPPLLGVNGAEYIGCYSDTSDRDLSGWFQRTHNTPQICVNTCKNKGKCTYDEKKSHKYHTAQDFWLTY